jgi:hypothetical protein
MPCNRTSGVGSMGPRQCCGSGLDLRLAAASVWRSRGLPLRYLGSYLQLHAVPQLNFTIPADLLDRIDAAKPNFLDRKGFICLLLSQQLDGSGTLGLASASDASPSSSYSSSKEEETRCITKTKTRARARDAYSLRAIDADLVPPDLLDCQQLLPEFWAVKKGTRSEGVWNRVCGKLRGWTPEQRREALERAIASGWGDVFEPAAQTAQRRGASGFDYGFFAELDRIEGNS